MLHIENEMNLLIQTAKKVMKKDRREKLTADDI